MNRGKQCNQIIEKYYDEIVRYCFFLLKDDFRGAEDCAHDTFLLLLRKQNELNLEQNIRGWLYASANRIVKDYRKKQLKFQAMLNYDPEDMNDQTVQAEEVGSSDAFDCLSDQELELLKAYYSAPKGERVDLARKHGMSISELYKKLHKIREKVRKSPK